MEDEDHRSNVFSELKVYCLDLLKLIQNPTTSQSSVTLPQLLHFLRSSTSDALQPFFDYALFPLLFVLDAAVDSRSSRKVNSDVKYVMLNVPMKTHMVSDSVAEGVLQCLEELLKKCRLGSVSQLAVVLKKLTYGALLTPSEAAEEFREGVIRCFRTLLLSLHPCPVNSCSCKQVLGLPAFLAHRDIQASLSKPSKVDKEPEECLLAFLRSQATSAAVGHWLSLLLKAADTEAARGHRGSAKLRVEAFLTFRVLVAKVGTADALAFFLPGVVSQLVKVLHVSKTMISGAAGSAEAIDQAVRGLVEFVVIVLQDDANLSELDSPLNVNSGFPPKNNSAQSFLEELRHLHINDESQSLAIAEEPSGAVVDLVNSESGFNEKKSSDSGMIGSFHVHRTKDWIKKTTGHVDKLLCATFPRICVHPAKRVRLGLLAGIQGILSKCSHMLKGSRLMLLECLCVLVCDDSEEVSADAQKILEYLFLSTPKHHLEHDVAEIFSRFIEKLPRVVLGSEELLALSHAQQLLALIYYSGPQIVVDHLLRSPITAAQFLGVFAQCLSPNSVFAGSLDKLLSARSLSAGYLQSVSELKSGLGFSSDDQAIMNPASSEVSQFQHKDIIMENMLKEYELPRMPPWFVYVGSQKLYKALAGILRLVGLSVISGFRTEGCLSIITDIPLGYLRKLVSELRMKESGDEGWQSWYERTGSGQLLRQASTAACILNEIIFGMSDQAIDIYTRMFGKSRIRKEEMQEYNPACSESQPDKFDHDVLSESFWNVYQKGSASNCLIDCVGSILHEYLSPEVWNLPMECKSNIRGPDGKAEEITLHFFQDVAMLHQEIAFLFVIIDGIGIFNICLGKCFDSSQFLHSSLYLLLENLTCSNYQIRSAADAVLHILSATSGFPTVGHLVVANSDYIIDSICRQLRHLNVNPRVSVLLAAMLSYIGVARKILPLLEEPMRHLSLELEVLGRNMHPDLTVPFLKAVAEISKASKHEASSLPADAESYCRDVKSKLSDMEKKTQNSEQNTYYDDNIDISHMESGAYLMDVDMHMEQLEGLLIKLNDSRRYRLTVGSIAGSCLTAATPLLASPKQAVCLVALDIIEDGIVALAKVEEAYRVEKETKETIERMISAYSFHHLQDSMDAADEGKDENRLLPAMNKIWPFLIVSVQNKNPVVVQRCLAVASTTVQICGGDFFSRRFHTDGPHFWKLLTTSPFQKKPFPKAEKTRLQLPYRSTSLSSDDSVAEVSNLKVQAALLNMIAAISQNKRSASALEVVLKKVSGLVVGVACSGVSGLRNASVNALVGLASMDPDLIWLLLADVYYSLKKKDMPSPPTSDLPEISHLLPPPSSHSGFLHVLYGGQTFGFDVDFVAVEIVFSKLHSLVFTSQMYI
ncbi:uncharacterized protein LOC131154857 [Malania oleifera]|uniref:uncharacterized protein LOC131154857 n=1 Tax=Malania oleifera TaxID=397392 RepID=UPI0025ADFF18|nr:uncharacterized protein LOC131154857 [Malania oleifera]